MFNRRTKNAILRFLQEEDGPTAVEYAVMLALILAVCILSVQFMAGQTIQSFQDSGEAIAGAFN
jgi:pilus assembly protein Flp/PilA